MTVTTPRSGPDLVEAVHGPDVVDLGEVDPARTDLVGGKGAALAALLRLDGVRVPPAVCVTTAAFHRVVAADAAVAAALGRLDAAPDDPGARGAVAAEVRHAVERAPLPDDLVGAVRSAVARLGEGTPLAVRSSATAEDLPGASFAGQHESHLGVVGADAVLDRVRRCWASLHTDRAVAYRRHAGIPHGSARMAVVVQRAVDAEAAGVVFTADPVTSDRRVVAVEAVPGLGEALVSGAVEPDSYRVRDGRVVERSVAARSGAVRLAAGGGTEVVPLEGGRRERAALADDDVLRLAALGRRLEAALGRPQDVEWCLAGGQVHVVQSRPITTLFPIPVVDDDRTHVFVSVGHQQMMTDPLRPLGLSAWQLTAGRPMYEAAGRPFVDVSPELASTAGRARLAAMLGRSDPLIGAALQTLIDRDEVPLRDATEGPGGGVPPIPPEVPDPDPGIVPSLIARIDESVETEARRIAAIDGPDVVDAVIEGLGAIRHLPYHGESLQVVMAGMRAAWWLDEHLREWLDERGLADVLSRSVPHNVTSEMGLALLDVADAVRPHPEVVAHLEQAGDDDGFLDGLDPLPGGTAARRAIEGWLERYGVRCVGEIDITRPRWVERPSALIPSILANVHGVAPGEARRRVERGREQAERTAREVLARLRALPDGGHKAAEAARAITRLRAFSGYREHPKLAIVRRYFVYKQALRREVDRLVAAGVLREPDDAWWLTLPELRDVAHTGDIDPALVDERREAFRAHEALTPPRVMTSHGEVVTGAYGPRDVPDGALVGLAVSAGTVEGRARVVRDIADAEVQPGDVLVTVHTDPGWTPLLVTAAGLVTEVGGLMTHGAVVAREYGLPAVVGVQDATALIADGQRIRVHGTDGYVEILDGPAAVSARAAST